MRTLLEDQPKPNFIHKLKKPKSFTQLLIYVVVVTLLTGVGTGYILASSGGKSETASSVVGTKEPPKNAQQDTRTFRDFAEGKITKKPASKDNDTYTEGTHILVRDKGVPVTLTSSVVDLNQYEGKKVKVYGETQKALESGWLMDVGRVEELK